MVHNGVKRKCEMVVYLFMTMFLFFIRFTCSPRNFNVTLCKIIYKIFPAVGILDANTNRVKIS